MNVEQDLERAMAAIEALKTERAALLQVANTTLSDFFHLKRWAAEAPHRLGCQISASAPCTCGKPFALQDERRSAGSHAAFLLSAEHARGYHVLQLHSKCVVCTGLDERDKLKAEVMTLNQKRDELNKRLNVVLDENGTLRKEKQDDIQLLAGILQGLGLKDADGPAIVRSIQQLQAELREQIRTNLITKKELQEQTRLAGRFEADLGLKEKELELVHKQLDEVRDALNATQLTLTSERAQKPEASISDASWMALRTLLGAEDHTPPQLIEIVGTLLDQRKSAMSGCLADCQKHVAETISPAMADLKTLRRLLWLRHDSEHTSALYGDDGEMSCNACAIDFKRWAPSLIEKNFAQQGVMKMHDAVKLARQPGESDLDVDRRMTNDVFKLMGWKNVRDAMADAQRFAPLVRHLKGSK